MTGELTRRYAVFVGFKMETVLRRALRDLSGPEAKYVSEDDPSFLMLYRLGDDEYVGKRIDDGLTTARVDDVRRNVVSILQRLVPETRLPQDLEILVCEPRVEPGD